MGMKWSRVPDGQVKHIWECPECFERKEVTPDFYEKSGTPVCVECDEDMLYMHTAVLMPELLDD